MMPTTEAGIDELKQHGREPAICELRCPSCFDGIGFSQKKCYTCGALSPRFSYLGDADNVSPGKITVDTSAF